MSPPAQATLATGAPVYAISFVDNRHFVYAGGGGPGRSGTEIQVHNGVPSLHPCGEIKLQANEDAPMCLDVHKQRAHLVCGINAPAEQLQQDLPNEHVRVFAYDVQSHPAARADAELKHA